MKNIRNFATVIMLIAATSLQSPPRLLEEVDLSRAMLGVMRIDDGMLRLDRWGIIDGQLSKIINEIIATQNHTDAIITTLDMHSNRITQLPTNIGQLDKLESLLLFANQLTEVPDFIANLTILQTLDLNNNQLTTLPGNIDRLTHLKLIDLSYNDITSLPSALINLHPECVIDLTGNPELGRFSRKITIQKLREEKKRHQQRVSTAAIMYHWLDQAPSPIAPQDQTLTAEVLSFLPERSNVINLTEEEKAKYWNDALASRKSCCQKATTFLMSYFPQSPFSKRPHEHNN